MEKVAERKPGCLLKFGILLMPPLFVWLLLQKGYSTANRILGFAWLGIVLLFFSLLGSLLPTPSTEELPPTVTEDHAAAGADATLLGRWCDVLVARSPRVTAEISLLSQPSGQTFVVTHYSDGSGGRPKVVRLRNGSYWEEDNEFGEHYRIEPTGALSILDNDGPIRTARSLATGQRCR